MTSLGVSPALVAIQNGVGTGNCAAVRGFDTSLWSPVARAVWAFVATRWALVVGRVVATRYAFVWPMPSWRLAVVAACVRSGLVLGVCAPAIAKGSYLVDPASSHMLVSKIKPCMSKYKHLIL